MSQQYSLRWNNHQPNFISMFTTLLNTQTLVDVTLAAEGKHLQAHKVVLSACSTYFQALFVDNPSRHPIVILKDVSFADLRTMVDFMYYGEVNVTEEQLPQVLDTAKLLKIKGLTEMPDSTSLTRSQGTSADFQSPGESIDSQRHSSSPATSPSNKRKRFVSVCRRRKSSTGSASLNMVMGEDNRQEEPQNLELMRGETITLSSVPQQRRREYHDDRAIDNAQQANDQQNLNVESVAMDANSAGLPQGAQWSMMEHAYPRYTNACLGGGPLQSDTGIYMNNVIDHHMDPDMSDYGQGMGVAGPSPGPSCMTDVLPIQDQPPPAQPKRRRTTNPQSEENFQRALEAVRFGGIGFCKAARMFGVNNRTLWLEYKKKVSVDDGDAQAYLKLRRLKHLKRQDRVQPEERGVHRQASEPIATSTPSLPTLQKHESYPQYNASKDQKSKLSEPEIGSLLIRTVAVLGRRSSGASASTSFEAVAFDAAGTKRASHTPAVRSGPPLSCHFCWNTVDECGRILRRKTQYHCPECRTNLCIVPCFHEYHVSHCTA